MFRKWLEKKYGDVKNLEEVWRRYGYLDWSQVDPPALPGPYPDFMDWVRFRVDNMYRVIQWHIDTIKAVDPEAVIGCHVTDDCSIYRYVDAGDDVWRSAEKVQIMGYTGGNGISPDSWDWQRWLHGDLTRSGSSGKPFWACELAAGPNWKSLSGLSREERIPYPGQVRSTEFTAMALGVSGILNCRVRPLQNGYVFGAFGYYDTDGTPTERSKAASKTAKWANAPEQKPLFDAHPVKGDIGILFEPETEIFLTSFYGTILNHTNMMGAYNFRYDPAKLKPLQDYATGIDSTYYANPVRGAYQAFMDKNIQVDFVKKEKLPEFKAVYVPCPIMLPKDTIAALRGYVENGGLLISEGAPAYFNEEGFLYNSQPCDALSELFGVKQAYVEFMPDLLAKEIEPFCVGNISGMASGLYIQKYIPTTGKAAGEYTRFGGVCAVENSFGKGRTLLIGTSPGMGYWKYKLDETRRFYSWLLEWSGIEQTLVTNSRKIMARLHTGCGYTALWIVNNNKEDIEAQVTISSKYGDIKNLAQHTDLPDASAKGRTVSVKVPAMDGFVAGLRF
jgi:beta-galactosidase